MRETQWILDTPGGQYSLALGPASPSLLRTTHDPSARRALEAWLMAARGAGRARWLMDEVGRSLARPLARETPGAEALVRAAFAEGQLRLERLPDRVPHGREERIESYAHNGVGGRSTRDELTWIAIRLEYDDDSGQGVAYARYLLKLPDGGVREGTLDRDGNAREDGLHPGMCEVTFPDFDRRKGAPAAKVPPGKGHQPRRRAVPASVGARGVIEAESDGLQAEWLRIAYEHADGSPVAGARFEVRRRGGGVLREGRLDGAGTASVMDLPLGTGEVDVVLKGDPETMVDVPVTTNERPLPTLAAGDDLKVASAIAAGGSISALDWALGVIAGDLNENPSLGQIVARFVLEMVPVVGQACALENVLVALYQLVWERRYDEWKVWFQFVLSVIGLVPEAGAVVRNLLRALVQRWSGPTLVMVLNGVAKGHGPRFIRALRDELPALFSSGKTLGGSLLGRVRDAIERVESQMPLVPASVRRQFTTAHDSIKECLGRLEKNFDDVESEIKKVLDDSLKALEPIHAEARTNRAITVRQRSHAAPESAGPRSRVPEEFLTKGLSAEEARDFLRSSAGREYWSDLRPRADITTGALRYKEFVSQVRSFSTVPQKRMWGASQISEGPNKGMFEGRKLYKVVPPGNGPKHSPFWLDEEQMRRLQKMSAEEIQHSLGLPKSSSVGNYEVYTIQPSGGPYLRPEDVPRRRVWVGDIAPTSEGELIHYGMGRQTVVVDRRNWTSPHHKGNLSQMLREGRPSLPGDPIDPLIRAHYQRGRAWTMEEGGGP